MVEPPASEADTAGTRLARARTRAALTLDQVAEKLRLDRSTVVALESDDHRSIGAAVFVRGFLRRYAALVGESPAEIEALYAQRPDAELRPDLSRTGMQRIEPDAHGRKLGLVPGGDRGAGAGRHRRDLVGGARETAVVHGGDRRTHAAGHVAGARRPGHCARRAERAGLVERSARDGRPFRGTCSNALASGEPNAWHVREWIAGSGRIRCAAIACSAPQDAGADLQRRILGRDLRCARHAPVLRIRARRDNADAERCAAVPIRPRQCAGCRGDPRRSGCQPARSGTRQRACTSL